jgi:TonB family protein
MGKATPLRAAKTLRCIVLSLTSALTLVRTPAQAEDSSLTLTRVAEAQLDSLAFRVGEKIKKNNRDESQPKVLVFDFTWKSPENSSRLGTLLADRFTELLNAHDNGLEVMDRKVLKGYFKDTVTNIEDLSVDSACLQLAEDLGATELIRANLVEDEERQLKIKVYVAGFEQRFVDEAEFPITKDDEDLLSQPVPLFSWAPDTIPAEPDVLALGAGSVPDVSYPVCIICPSAPSSELSRRARVNGTILLSAIVTTNGEVTSVYVLKRLPLGLTRDLVNTVRTWKFNPAIKDGKPIAARIEIEVTYKMSPPSPE